MEVSGQHHVLAALSRVKSPRYPLHRGAGWAPEPVYTLWRREKSCPCHESNPSCPARSLLLYRLSYPGSSQIKMDIFNFRNYHGGIYQIIILILLTTTHYVVTESLKYFVFSHVDVIELLRYVHIRISLEKQICSPKDFQCLSNRSDCVIV
jgi:hypothetical protein